MQLSAFNLNSSKQRSHCRLPVTNTRSEGPFHFTLSKAPRDDPQSNDVTYSHTNPENKYLLQPKTSKLTQRHQPMMMCPPQTQPAYPYGLGSPCQQPYETINSYPLSQMCMPDPQGRVQMGFNNQRQTVSPQPMYQQPPHGFNSPLQTQFFPPQHTTWTNNSYAQDPNESIYITPNQQASMNTNVQQTTLNIPNQQSHIIGWPNQHSFMPDVAGFQVPNAITVTSPTCNCMDRSQMGYMYVPQNVQSREAPLSMSLTEEEMNWRTVAAIQDRIRNSFASLSRYSNVALRQN